MTRPRIGRTVSLAAAHVTAILLLSAASADESTVLRGRVLLPDGKPAAGAELYWVHSEAASTGLAR